MKTFSLVLAVLCFGMCLLDIYMGKYIWAGVQLALAALNYSNYKRSQSDVAPMWSDTATPGASTLRSLNRIEIRLENNKRRIA